MNFALTEFSEPNFGELRKSGHREDAPGALMVHTHTRGDVDSRRTPVTAENTPTPAAPDTIVLIHGLWVTPRS